MAIAQLAALKKRLVAYARLVEDMVGKCREALARRRWELLDDVVEIDEPRADDSEMSLEEEATAIIATHQPMARELRTVLLALRMTGDLERMADHAVNIAEAVGEYIGGTGPEPAASILEMFEGTLRMLADAIQAFVDEDPQAARRTCAADGRIDALAATIIEQLGVVMTEDSREIDAELALLKMATNLERVADLATNICEDVVYAAEGRVIKHHRERRQDRRLSVHEEIEAKFLVPDQAASRRLRAAAEIAGYALGPGSVRTVRDTYVDTRERALLAAGWACRLREQDGRIRVTVKTASTAGDAIHRRREMEAELLAEVPPALWPDGEVRELVVGLVGAEELVGMFMLRQERAERVASAGSREVALVSLDEVVVQGAQGARSWRELEIELLPGGTERDLASMASWVRERYGLAPSMLSKFERALGAAG